MTCIIGLKHEGKVYIGADSLGSNGHTKTVRSDMKVFKPYSNIVLGYTSSYRMGQLLMYNEELFKKVKTHKQMVKKFIPRLQQLYDENGYSKKFSDGEKSGGIFIVGIDDKLFKVESDFQVGVTSDDYVATGCGEELALGSLHSTEGKNPIERIKLALESAEKFSVGVQRPFYIMNTYDGEVIEIK